jgi:hypothetical protein
MKRLRVHKLRARPADLLPVSKQLSSHFSNKQLNSQLNSQLNKQPSKLRNAVAPAGLVVVSAAVALVVADSQVARRLSRPLKWWPHSWADYRWKSASPAR